MPNQRKCGSTSMWRLRHVLAGALAWLAVTSSGVAASGLEALHGRWAAATGQPPVMEWGSGADGVTLRWTPEGHDAVLVVFAPAGRPDVFAGKIKEGWSMFGDGPVNPLRGDTLVWARTAKDTTFVYTLGVQDDGRFQLDRYALRRDGDALVVTLERRTPAGEEEPREQRLVRTDR